jgi:hypothetical protein
MEEKKQPKKKQSPCRHNWRELSWKEAYPAPGGKLCTKCGTTRINWFR